VNPNESRVALKSCHLEEEIYSMIAPEETRSVAVIDTGLTHGVMECAHIHCPWLPHLHFLV